jgi:hypothetical protein
MLQNFTNVIKGQIILIMWNTLSQIETKFNEMISYNIFKKQIKQYILLYTSHMQLPISTITIMHESIPGVTIPPPRDTPGNLPDRQFTGVGNLPFIYV